MKSPGLVLGLLFIGALNLEAEPVLQLVETRGEYNFQGIMRTARDPSGKKSLEEMLPLLEAAPVETAAEPNFGSTTDAVWALMRVTNTTPTDQYHLYLGFHLFSVTLYYYSNGHDQIKLDSGFIVPPKERPYRHRFSVFPVSLKPGVTYNLVLRIKANGTLSIPAYLYTPQAFREQDDAQNLLLLIILGILLGLTIYNLFLAIAARHMLFLYFVFFSVFHLIFQIAYNGVGDLFLWPNSTILGEYALDLGGCFALIAANLFAMAFLQTRKKMPGFHKVFIALIVMAGLTVPLILAGQFHIALDIIQVLLVGSSIFIVICSIISFVRGDRSARFFILAYVSLVITALIVSLKYYNLLPSSFLGSQALLFGSGVESILLSLAIADRINSLRAVNAASHTALEASRENEIRILRERFYLDPMTGLPNRNRLILDMQKDKPYSLFFINIDRFREVNDLYGTLIGNRVLMEIANRLKSNGLDRTNKVYRLHADDFAVLVECELKADELCRLGEDLHLLCQNPPYDIDPFLIPLSVTVGCASAASGVLSKADMALAHARETGKGCAAFVPEYDATNRIQENLSAIQLLRRVIEDDMVFPVFMPIMRNKGKTVEKYEVLMRLRDAAGRVHLPSGFLDVAKRSKLYAELERRIIRKSIAYGARLPYELSINLSVLDILDRDSMRLLWDSVAAHPQPANIVFELIESESIAAYDPVARFIEEARARGCKIAIDDFGSGYSNFEYLLRLHVDYLKIDGSLIRDMHTDRNARIIVETIAQFARRLAIQTVAEFVHCEDVFNLVSYFGINFSQGNFVGVPVEKIGGETDAAPSSPGAANSRSESQ